MNRDEVTPECVEKVLLKLMNLTTHVALLTLSEHEKSLEKREKVIKERDKVRAAILHHITDRSATSAYEMRAAAGEVQPNEKSPAAELEKPIDMVLFCPQCGCQHLDMPDSEPTAYPDGRESMWENPPHRSHLCHNCHHIWRPADVATNGVATVKTRGKHDSCQVFGRVLATGEADLPAKPTRPQCRGDKPRPCSYCGNGPCPLPI